MFDKKTEFFLDKLEVSLFQSTVLREKQVRKFIQPLDLSMVWNPTFTGHQKDFLTVLKGLLTQKVESTIRVRMGANAEK